MQLQILIVLCLSCISKGSMYCVSSTDSTVSRSCGRSSVQCSNSTTIAVGDIQGLVNDHVEIELNFCSSHFYLNAVNITFANMDSVTIVGAGGRAHLINTMFGFNNVKRILVKNITFSGFEVRKRAERSSKTSTLPAVLQFCNCVDVTVADVSIENCSGLAIALANNTGKVRITNSSFDNIRSPKSSLEGHGVNIESSTSENSYYHIENCNFTNSVGVDSENDNHPIGDIDVVRRGGLNVYFRAKTSNVSVTIYIINCVFANNTAGALSIVLCGSVHDVTVKVERSRFENNVAQRGGAVLVQHVHETKLMPHNPRNRIEFHSCNFTGNEAHMGGGVYLSAAPSYYYQDTNNSIEFQGCNWTKNVALFGAAVLATPFISKRFEDGHLPHFRFENCSFIKNHNNNMTNTVSKGATPSYNIVHYGLGTVYVNSFHVEFHGHVQFIDNSDSAIHIFSGKLKVASNCYLVFRSNTGYRGGAINLEGVSSIYVNDYASILFDSNTARDRGGAIFQNALNDRSGLSAKNCFMKYAGRKNVSERNISVFFTNNSITKNHTYRGQSIFLFSAKPCSAVSSGGEGSIHEALNSIANFEFEDGRSVSIGTSPSTYTTQESSLLEVIPGKETHIEVGLVDETNYTIKRPVYGVTVISPNNSISISPGYSIITNNKIKLQGLPGSKGSLRISIVTQLRGTSLTFNVSLQECPPGYVHDKKTCICSANTKTPFLGIPRCNVTTFRANLVQGNWAGYKIGNSGSERVSDKDFRTSNCPIGYCNYKSDIALPDSKPQLDALICNDNREGILCARCKENTSVFYHTQNAFDCIENRHCHLGFFFYVLSELVPVTFLFLAVIFFDIQLTTGTLNGFLLYMQTFSTLPINGNIVIAQPKVTKNLLTIFASIVKAFNLNFFALPHLSFCLFEGANSLNLLAFHYVTVVYSLLLILLTVVVMNIRCNKIRTHFRFLVRRRKTAFFSRSIVHGLSGFLVMCYARTTLISLRLLTPTRLYGGGKQKRDLVVFYYGELDFLKTEHLKYAIPAILALVFVTFPPPFFLLIYPLCYKVLALLKLEESKFTKILCRVVPLEKFKPFFDSIQSTFRDNCRFFAGLYYSYRLSTLLIFVIARNVIQFYFLLELQFVLMLALHAWVQPYKKKWHNRLDLYMFSLLVLINGIALRNYQESTTLLNNPSSIAVLSTIQVILAYSPLVFMILYFLRKLKLKQVLIRLRRKIRNKKEVTDTLELSISVLDRERRVENSHVNYELVD